MADTQFLRLNEKWGLGYDSLQWIIQRRGSFDKRSGEYRWIGESFISSNRDILVLTLREKGVVIDPDKMEEVLALPYSFREWIGRRQGREAAGRRQGGLDIAAKKPHGGEIEGGTARSRVFPVSGSSRVSAGSISAFGVKAPEHPYQPEDGEDLLAISPFLDRKAEVPPDHPLRMCRKAKAKAA